MIEIGGLAETPAEAIKRGAELAPYLQRLSDRLPDHIRQLLKGEIAKDWFDAIIASVESIPADTKLEDVMVQLRQAKQGVHLAIAAGDLSGQFSQIDVTKAITKFADVSVEVALQTALRSRGLKPDGIFIIAHFR